MAIKQTVELLNFLDKSGDATSMHDAAFEYAKNHIAPLNAAMDRDNVFPKALWKSMGDQGLHGITIDESYGGIGGNYLMHCGIVEAISYYSGSVGLSYGAHSNLCMNQIQLNGTAFQKEKYLPLLNTGDYVGGLAMSDANAGSDVMAMSLVATECQGGFMLNGPKMWITNAGSANVLVVYAKLDPADKRSMTAFLVESDPKSISCTKIDKMGMRGSETYEMSFNNHFVPQENILGAVGKGANVLMSGLNYERMILAAGPLGIAQSSFDYTMNYLKRREQFGQPLFNNQVIGHEMAEMTMRLAASRSHLYTTTAMAVKSKQLSNEAAASVLFMASDTAKDITQQCITLAGGMGYTRDIPLEQNFRDTQLYEIGAGARHIRKEIVWRGLKAD